MLIESRYRTPECVKYKIKNTHIECSLCTTIQSPVDAYKNIECIFLIMYGKKPREEYVNGIRCGELGTSCKNVQSLNLNAFRSDV